MKLIQKITKTMKMIANSRLREAQNAMLLSRPFCDTVQNKEEIPIDDSKKKLLLAVFSDRGLCGALNSSMGRIVRNVIKEREKKALQTSVIVVGDKGSNNMQRMFSERVLCSFGSCAKKGVGFIGASAMTEKIFANSFDTISIFFNRFKTILTYVNEKRDFIHPDGILASRSILSDYEFEEDDRLSHVRDFLEYQVAVSLFSAIMENAASELGARMCAMDNATKNSTEIIGQLGMKYNRMRQAAITTELNEVCVLFCSLRRRLSHRSDFFIFIFRSSAVLLHSNRSAKRRVIHLLLCSDDLILFEWIDNRYHSISIGMHSRLTVYFIVKSCSFRND